jgi:3D (Asp-Asp-Asp) domain-containing protein
MDTTTLMNRAQGAREYRRQVRYSARMRRPEPCMRPSCVALSRWVLILVAVALGACILLSLRAGAAERTSRRMRVTATGYCAGPCAICQTTGITATGRDAYTRGIAVDPKVIRIGARIDVPEHGSWLPADDVGGAIIGEAIDVRFDTHAEAREWGRREIVVRVWE